MSLPRPETQIEALLKERIGLDAETIGGGAIARAVRDRALAVGARDTAAYWNLLHAAPDELQALIEAVIVPETWFFRHRGALLALARVAAQRVFGAPGMVPHTPGPHPFGPHPLGTHAGTGGDPPLLRILSVPCSTGEEPYSIAMALLDVGIPAARFRVDAVDISARSLERARIGHYGSNAFRGRPLDFRDRHFVPAPAGYQLSEAVRAQVRLLRGNLMDPLLLANEPPYHFVFCRNLLIYFDADTQRRAVRTLQRLTRTDGMIFVGPAEASLLTREGLSGTGVPLAFAFHPHDALPRAAAAPGPASAARVRSGAAAGGAGGAGSATARLRPPQAGTARSAAALPGAAGSAAPTAAAPKVDAPDITAPGFTTPIVSAPNSAAPDRNPAPSRPGAANVPASGGPASAVSPAAVSPAVASASPSSSSMSGDAAARAELAAIAAQADRGELEAATAACRDYLARHAHAADAYCLLGVLHDAAGRTADAQSAYRKAVYLDPGHEEALYHLAALLESSGDAAGAGRLRQRAQRHARLNHG
ncbi:CheR family methyltransferase [Cupriavidus sp. Marseille-Q8015]